MSSQIRHRVAGAAIAAFLVAAPGLAATPVRAAPVLDGPAPADSVDGTESGKQVVFSGSGLLGLSCVARPDSRALTVVAGTTMWVANRTGYRARLLLNGETQGEIEDGGSAQVLFRRGPVTLSLRPS